MREGCAKYEMLCRGVKCFLNLNQLLLYWVYALSSRYDKLLSTKKCQNLRGVREGDHKQLFTLLVGMASYMVWWD